MPLLTAVCDSGAVGWLWDRILCDVLGVAPAARLQDYPTIVGYGVMATPALVVDEEVVPTGRVPSAAEVRNLLTAAVK